MSVGCAKTAAVFSVIYAGVNLYQMLAHFDDVRDKAKMFAEIAAGEGGTGRLRVVRALFYLAAPLLYLWTLICAGLPGAFLVTAGAKFWISSFIGVRTEHRLIRGEEYSTRDHNISRIDAAANIALAAGAVWLILATWA
jgi:hypothetical protein